MLPRSELTGQPPVAAPGENCRPSGIDAAAETHTVERRRQYKVFAIQSAGIGALFVGIVVGWAYWQAGSAAFILPYLHGERFVIRPTQFVFDDVKPGSTVKAALHIANLSGSEVRLIGAEKSCSCLTLEDLPIRVASGQQRDLTVEYAIGPGARGEGQQSVTFYTDSSDAPTITVRLRAIVR